MSARGVLERLLNLLAFLLTAGRPVTADEIRVTVAGYEQDSDEAFRRMFERDKDLLRRIGVPVEMRPTDVWELEHGYVIPSDLYELPDPGLTDEELASLWLAAQIVRMGGRPQGPEALFKLGGLGMMGGGEPLGADLGLAAEDLEEVFRAVTERRRIEFEYHERPRRLEPYGLVHRRGHWYVVGQSSDGMRVFRVDRMGGLVVDEEADAFRRPKGFRVSHELARYPWEAGTDELRVLVRFDPRVAWWARRQVGDADLRDEEDGGLVAELQVANPEAFIGWILSFEDAAEILEPAEMRSRLVERVGAEA